MLVIYIGDDPIRWECGKPEPKMYGKDLHLSFECISFMWADGIELKHIRRLFCGIEVAPDYDRAQYDSSYHDCTIPMLREWESDLAVVWTGDIARTIYMNLFFPKGPR